MAIDRWLAKPIVPIGCNITPNLLFLKGGGSNTLIVQHSYEYRTRRPAICFTFGDVLCVVIDYVVPTYAFVLWGEVASWSLSVFAQYTLADTHRHTEHVAVKTVVICGLSDVA